MACSNLSVTICLLSLCVCGERGIVNVRTSYHNLAPTQLYLKELTWTEIENGNAMRFYTRLMRDLDDINRRWGVRHIMTLLAQCIQLSVGISQLINELNICSDAGEHLFECENITYWQHGSTAVIIANIFLDFYGMFICVIKMLTHSHLFDDVTTQAKPMHSPPTSCRIHQRFLFTALANTFARDGRRSRTKESSQSDKHECSEIKGRYIRIHTRRHRC